MKIKINDFFIMLVVGLFTVGITVSVYLYSSGFNFELFFQKINLDIGYKVILVLLIYLFRNYLLVPSTVVILFSGYYLQQFWLTLLIALIGVSLGFLQTYFVGYTFSSKLLNSDKFSKINEYKVKINQQGYKVIFFGALFPVISVDVLYYSAGIIRYNLLKAYLAGIVGELPLIILYVYLGKQAQKYTNYFVYIFIVIALIYSIILGIRYYKRNKKS